MTLPSFRSNRFLSRRSVAVLFRCVVAGTLLASTLALQAQSRAIQSRIPPVYPEIAKRLGITGDVLVQASVAADGTVTAVRVLNGSSMLSTAAITAVQQWRFAPGTVPSTVNVDLNFTLDR